PDAHRHGRLDRRPRPAGVAAPGQGVRPVRLDGSNPSHPRRWGGGVTDTPFPPGRYPAVVIGSGPGGLQIAYLLGRRGIAVAHLTADPSPGGMFRRLPLFDRLLSWSKPAPPPADPGRGPE